MWIDVRPNGDSNLGDSIMTQLNGNIGIGLDTPTSKLTVQGMIETTLGGYKFPDGTVQTTAAVSGLQSVFHDETLQGLGTTASRLRVAIPLNLTTASSFLVPILTVRTFGGGVGVEGLGGVGIKAIGNGGLGIGVSAEGAEGGTVKGGGPAVVANGGNSLVAGEKAGGSGVEAFTGSAPAGGGGDGVIAVGGDGILGGDGVSAVGGTSSGLIGGNGVHADGGDSINSGGGHGVVASGGIGTGPGHFGGIGIVATHGVGKGGAANGDAGLFNGNVTIAGELNVTGTKNFKIDHPLNPENKYLLHAAIESAEVLNLYSGNVRLDANGEATVKLPEWFEAVNQDFRYALTSVGAPGQGLHIAEEVSNNQFKIAGGQAGAKVSWQVTGIRSDAAMRNHPFKAEEDKPERERGYYLSPEAYDQPEERSVAWARNPELMRQMKERREQMRRKMQANKQ